MITVTTTDKNLAVCLFNTGLFIEMAGTGRTVMGDDDDD